jgi:uncharacterized protein (TIGR00645 family)
MAITNEMERIIEKLILASRWLLVPLYLALASVLGIFAVRAVQEVMHLFAIVATATESELVLAVLGFIDLTLVANLLVMVVLSGYETFISRIDTDEGEEKPSWLGKVDAGTLKIKLSVSIVAISAIHLLGAFINIEHYNNQQLLWLVIIHLTFVVSALLLTFIDKIAFSPRRDH